MDLPCHIFQELTINTDIAYDLDMSKFPGLEDPEKQLQPALVICTPEACQRWLSALQDDASPNASADSLYNLIDICSLDIMLHGCASDGDQLDRFLDDVFDDSPSTDQAGCCSGVSGFSLSDSGHFSSTTPDVQQSPSSNSDDNEFIGYTNYLGYPEDSGTKRKREADRPDSNKRLKIEDFVYIPCFSKGVYDIHRDS